MSTAPQIHIYFKKEVKQNHQKKAWILIPMQALFGSCSWH